MRNPQKIPDVLSEIERIWQLYPDMRLGQLISNLADWAEKSVWDLEEDELLAEIDRHLKNREVIARGEIESLREGG